MKLEGSCCCQKVQFSVESLTPYPYMNCYCSICRKTQGGGGAGNNIMAETKTFKIQGSEFVRIYQPTLNNPDSPEGSQISSTCRHFCSLCGSHLWHWDPRWPELLFPLASAIDTPLPKPPERLHIFLDSAASWCEIPSGDHEIHFKEFPEESMLNWHKRHQLYEEPQES